MQRVFCVLIGYVCGCIQSAEIVQKLLSLQGNIREQGTGIPGTANMMQTYGAKAGIFTFLLDALKAALATVGCRYLFIRQQIAAISVVYAGLGAILGHCWPANRRFKGGRGIACLYGIATPLGWGNFLILVAGEVFGVILSRLMIGGAIGAATMFLAGVLILPFTWEVRLIGGIIWGIIMIRHIEKFKSIARGEELKFSFSSLPSMFKKKK